MSWRPENYEEVFGEMLQSRYRDDMSIKEVSDIGADAFYEAIWKMAKESPTGTFIFDTNTINIYFGKEQ